MSEEDNITNAIAIKASHGKDISKEDTIRIAARLRSMWPEIEVYKLSNTLHNIQEKRINKKNSELIKYIKCLEETEKANRAKIQWLKDSLESSIKESAVLKYSIELNKMVK